MDLEGSGRGVRISGSRVMNKIGFFFFFWGGPTNPNPPVKTTCWDSLARLVASKQG
jgi:hypothetical protein